MIQVFLSIIVRKYCNIFRVHKWFHAQLAQKYWMVSIAHKMRWTNQLVTLENQGPTVFWRLNRGSTWEFLPVCHKALLEPCYWPVYLKVKIFTIGALYTPQRLGYNAPRPPRPPPFWFPGNVRVKPHFNTQLGGGVQIMPTTLILAPWIFRPTYGPWAHQGTTSIWWNLASSI